MKIFTRYGLASRILGGWGILLLTVCSTTSYANPSHTEGFHIEKVIMVMRGGARSTTSETEVLQYSNRTWPDFGVPDGHLTAHGWVAMMSWGQYHRRRLARQGVVAMRGALAPEQMRAFPSPRQRSRDSTVAFLQGFAPHSDVMIDATETRDWFLPPRHGLQHTNPVAIRHAVEHGLGMRLPQAESTYRPVLQTMESLLGIQPGRLSLMLWEPQIDDDGLFIPPLRAIDRMVETVRMQYANNLPLGDVGFGAIGHQAALAYLAVLQDVHHEATQRPRYLAVREAAPLLERLLAALLDELGGTGEPFSLYMGHAANIAAIRAVFGFDWRLQEHIRNDVVPGGMLMFERIRHLPSGERFVRLSYHSPTMDQIRHLHVFHDQVPAFEAIFQPPPLFESPGANLIPLRRFEVLMREVFQEAALDRPTAANDEVAETVTHSASPNPPLAVPGNQTVPCGASTTRMAVSRNIACTRDEQAEQFDAQLRVDADGQDAFGDRASGRLLNPFSR